MRQVSYKFVESVINSQFRTIELRFNICSVLLDWINGVPIWSYYVFRCNNHIHNYSLDFESLCSLLTKVWHPLLFYLSICSFFFYLFFVYLHFSIRKSPLLNTLPFDGFQYIFFCLSIEIISIHSSLFCFLFLWLFIQNLCPLFSLFIYRSVILCLSITYSLKTIFIYLFFKSIVVLRQQFEWSVSSIENWIDKRFDFFSIFFFNKIFFKILHIFSLRH